MDIWLEMQICRRYRENKWKYDQEMQQKVTSK